MQNSDGKLKNLPRPMAKFLLFLAKVMAFPIFRCYCRLAVEGVENIPSRTPCIIASNHTSYLDPPLLGFVSKRPFFYFSKKQLLNIPIFGRLIRICGALPLSGSRMSTSDLRMAINILNHGNALVLFPEGTRSHTGKLLRAKPGVGFIALRTGVPVVPVHIDGTYSAMPPRSNFIRPVQIRVRIGKPMQFNDGAYQDIADRIMEEIRELGAKEWK
jgi:1-acyl-sn-glycerol-3-phosphate acyltransferase